MNATGWGGRREGAGGKPAGYQHPEGRVDFERERAEHERVKRKQREFKLAQERGEYISRQAVQQAAATALAVLSQSARAIPDNLERVCNLTPEQADLAQQQVDAALTEIAAAFRAMTGSA